MPRGNLTWLELKIFIRELLGGNRRHSGGDLRRLRPEWHG